MAIDPRILASIANPTGGRLGEIGKSYVNARQMAMENERNAESDDRDKKEFEIQMADVGSKVMGAYSKSTIAWREGNPDKTDEEFAEFQLNEWNNLDPAHQQLVPKDFQSLDALKQGARNADAMQRALHPEDYEAESVETFSDFSKIPNTELYGQKSSKTGKYTNIKDSIDGNTHLGSSEFERHLAYLKKNNLVTQKKYDELIGDRAEGFAGEMDKGEISRLDEKQKDRYNREVKDLRKEYTAGSDHFRSMGTTIDSAMAAMDSGDTKLSEILLNQVMSQVQDTNVRAFQMYGEFDKEFGNLAQRITGKLSRFFEGSRTTRETEEIRSVLTKFNESYVRPAETKLRDRYRRMAINDNKKPFDVVPPKNPEDIRDSTLLDNTEKLEMIKEYFPDWKPK